MTLVAVVLVHGFAETGWSEKGSISPAFVRLSRRKLQLPPDCLEVLFFAQGVHKRVGFE